LDIARPLQVSRLCGFPFDLAALLALGALRSVIADRGWCGYRSLAKSLRKPRTTQGK
jgi:hypothetical protein